MHILHFYLVEQTTNTLLVVATYSLFSNCGILITYQYLKWIRITAMVLNQTVIINLHSRTLFNEVQIATGYCLVIIQLPMPNYQQRPAINKYFLTGLCVVMFDIKIRWLFPQASKYFPHKYYAPKGFCREKKCHILGKKSGRGGVIALGALWKWPNCAYWLSKVGGYRWQICSKIGVIRC